MSTIEQGSESPISALPAAESPSATGGRLDVIFGNAGASEARTADDDAPTFVIPLDDEEFTAEFPVDSTFTSASLRVVDAADVQATPDVRSTSAERASRVRRLWTDFASLAGFLLLALWVISPYWTGARVSASDSSDQAFFEWMLAHGAEVVTHFSSPLYTTQL